MVGLVVRIGSALLYVGSTVEMMVLSGDAVDVRMRWMELEKRANEVDLLLPYCSYEYC